ncbi:hypothetical protein OG562_12000 [Streptomyces sp. NBC_01275]|uniref:hypothetical protein n=1 Tax=Streptomyces sp. NBC_01275 TaxID=2903807 RepID=UPI002252070E|nr:hypothetical protein [Streptomyces sp. NBC_01275]MCX4761687.1 hypothetical protein [Streptomyces sp. NBC_01275]
MIVVVLAGVLALAVGGCVCIWWASTRGGPRWVRVIALGTMAAGELVRGASRGAGRNRSSGSNQNSGSDD